MQSQIKLGIVLILIMVLVGCAAGNNSSISPSTSSTTPTASGSFSGKITDESGNGIARTLISINISTNSAQKKRTSKYTTITDENGNFIITGLQTGDNYFLTVSHEGYKTLIMEFKLGYDILDLSVVIIVPKGTGTIEFEMPTPLLLNQPVSHTNSVDLSWQSTTNIGFVAYILYRSNTAETGTTESQLVVDTDPNSTTYTDQISTACYYRVYEKIFIPELDETIMIGSNEVLSVFPTVTSFSPVGDNVALDSIIEITFSNIMNQTSVENDFNITSNFPSDTITGMKSWSGQTFRFTPLKSLGYTRIITVSLPDDIKDANGNDLSGVKGWNFKTKNPFTKEAIIAPGSTPHLQLDILNRPCVLIGDYDTQNLGLYIKNLSSSQWERISIDSNGDAFYNRNNMTKDDFGNLYIAYRNGTSGNMNLAYYNFSTLTNEIFDTGLTDTLGEHYVNFSIVVDSDNQPCISYSQRSMNNLKFAQKKGGIWSLQEIDNGGNFNVCIASSIAIDKNGNPCIAYRFPVEDNGKGYLKFARYNGYSWTVETIDSAGTSGVSLAFDSAGNPHIVYNSDKSFETENYGCVDGKLKYTYYNGSSWEIQTLSSDHCCHKTPSLIINSLDYPSIAYSGGNSIDSSFQVFIQFDGTNWSSILHFEGPETNYNGNLIIDDNGIPHIVFANAIGDGTVFYSKFDNP